MGAIVSAGRRITRLPLPLLLGLAVLLAVLGGYSAARYRTQPTAIPFPVPVYQIESKSGSCTGSIANLGIGYIGTLEAPMPVDVDCDLLPDVLVAINLIDLEGPLNDPLASDSTSYEDFLADRVGRTLAPNIEINRYPLNALASILNRPSPPVRLNVKLTLKDLELQEPDTILRFGYETGVGGSIPGNFKAVVRGIEDFFNPLEAVVDTKGDLQGGDTVPSYYEGPLTLVGGLTKGDFDAKLDIAYKPFPDVVKVGYASDDAGNHIDYAHGVGEQILRGYGTALPDGTFEHYVPGELPEVDMFTKLDVVDGADTMHLDAALDRLPREIGLDFDTPTDAGRLDYRAANDGRLPDARVNIRSVSEGELTRAQAFIEEIPPELHAQWAMADDDLVSALFTTSDPDDPDFDLDDLGAGPGIGAIEVLYSNVDVPTEFVPFVPTQQQYLNLQTLGDEQLITGRVEKVRGLRFDTRDDGFDIASRVGDGAMPLEANIQIDGLPESGDSVDASATITPLPSSIDVNVFSGTEGDLADPFRVEYKSSDGVDVDSRAELREADAADAECGEPGTTCADIGLRHLPAELSVAIGENGVEGAGATTDAAIDMVRRPGSPKPDVFLDAILGKLDSVDDPDAVEKAGPVLFEADAVLRGIPDTIRLHFVEGADETLERLDVATCELDATEKCPADTDPIESLEVQVRNFRDAERGDALVPHPSSVAPQFATITARGIDDPDKTADPTVRFEAAARVFDITEVRYANVNGLFGVRSAVGDESDLEVLLDVQDVIFAGNDPKTGPVDLRGRALISPLPSEIDLCLREADFPLDLSSSASFTERCESTDPFLDDSVETSPMTLSYLANRIFDVDAAVDMTEHGLLDAVSDDHTIHGVVSVDNVPKDLTAHIQKPPEAEEGAPPATEPERLRVRTIAPGADDTNVDLTFEDRLGGATCADPQPAGDITCATATIQQLPVYASVVADTGPGEDTHARVYACDLDISDTTCRDGSEGVIEELTARLRMVTGDPVEEGDLVPFVYDEHPYAGATPPSGAYTLALRLDQDDEDNKELRAEGRLEDFRSLSFDKTEEGFDIHTDLGDGVKPLLGSVAMDTRVPADAPPPPEGEEPETGQLIVADTRVSPLPEEITISQHGPGDDQQENPLDFTYDSTAPVQVDARAQIFDQVAGELCGDHGTVCATLHLDRLPSHISTTVGTFDEEIADTPEPDVRRRMFVDLDAIPFGSVDAPDLVFDAVLGSTVEGEPPLDGGGNPIFDDTPTVAHGELRGFSEKARIRLAQTGVLQEDESLKDAQFEEALFVTCELLEGEEPPSCGPVDDDGSPLYDEFPVEEIAISARNFHSRPTDFPVPRRTDVPDRDEATPANSDTMYAEAVARGDDFEAHAGFTSVREFRMRSVDDILGVKVRGGDGQGFTAHGDLAGIVLPDTDLTEDGDVFPSFEEQTLALDANVTLSNVPTTFAFCMRQSGAPIKPLTGDFTEPCEAQHPFADEPDEPFFEAEAPESAPMALAYRANAPITQITTNAKAQILRTEVVDTGPLFGELRTALPTINVLGDVTIDNLPKELTAHIETPVGKKDQEEPVEDGGPIRALFFYDEEADDPVDITFAAEYTENDAVCKDIRLDQVAFCIGGKLENLPKLVKAYVDPEAPLIVPGEDGEPPSLVQNLRVLADNEPGQKLNLRNLDISVVKKDDDPTKPPLILVAEGSILGLPERVDGTIHMPDEDPEAFDKPAFDIVASPPLDTVDLQVRNFVAPDPLPEVAAPRGGASVDQSITFLQRGDFFKADVFIEDVAGGGFRTGRNAAGQATETQLIRVDFGIPAPGDPKPTIRGYVDLLTDDEEGNPTHVFADVLLDDMPHGLDICFRGEFPAPEDIDHDLVAAPGTEVFCDEAPTHLGAFRFQGRTSSDPEPELDVNAIFRMTKGSDTNVLKAVADITNIPNVIEGTFGDGAVAVESYKANGTTPTGIDDVVAEMADFDFDDDGYGDAPPWGVRVPGTVVLPPVQPGPDHEFARVASNGTDFHVKAHVGTDAGGGEGARITKLIMEPEHCAQPSGASTYFPYYPDVDTNEYTCIKAELESHSDSPLLVDADLVLDGTHLQILDAGLTEVPKWFQATIAKTPTVAEQDGIPDVFRRRCGTNAVEEAALDDDDPPADCMPPLLHFDSEGDSQLFGRLLVGDQADLDTLKATPAFRTMSDLEAVPVPPVVRGGADPWAEFTEDGGTGVRVKLGEFPKDPDVEGSEDRKAVRASFRLNLPQALTVDQVQDWSFDDAASGDDLYRSAKDLRFHFVMRDAPASGSTPVIVDVAGQLQAMIHNYDGNGQTLVSNYDNDTKGIPIPGEFGLDLFDRDYKGRGRHLIQADLRTSATLSARLRLIQGDGESLGDIDARLKDLNGVPAGDASYQTDPEKPSFRVRAELRDPKDKIVPDPPDTTDWKDVLLCFVFCIADDVGPPAITAHLDLEPNNGSPVRMLEAVVNTEEKLGLELRGYGNIEGTTSADFESKAFDGVDLGFIPGARGGVHVDIDPFNFFLHAGVPILASFDLLIAGDMNVDLSIAKTDRFVLRQNSTALQAASDGADLSFPDLGSNTWLQVMEAPGVLAGFFSLFWPFPPVYLFYEMTAAPVVPFAFYHCPTPAFSGPIPWTYPIGTTERKVTAFLPFDGPIPIPPLFTFGTPIVKEVLDALFGLAGPPIMCAAFSTDGIKLHTGTNPLTDVNRIPGDPMLLSGHPVRGLVNAGTPDDVGDDPDDPPGPQDLTVAGTLALCGTHVFENINIPVGTTVNVATAPADNAATPYVECPADVADDADTPDQDETQINVGRLNLVAGSTFTLAGTVNGASTGEVNLTGEDLTVTGSGRVNVAKSLVSINAGDQLSVAGIVSGNAVSDDMPSRPHDEIGSQLWAEPAHGNSGAGHGGPGGVGTGADDPGFDPDNGPAYGSGVASVDIDPGTERGSKGASTAATAGGNGGGAVALRGSVVNISGTVRMNGAQGQDNHSGVCAVEDDPDTEGDETAANTGVPGAGGGSGGGIAVHGITVNVTGSLQAIGGRGGDGKHGGGGGGGGGYVRLNAGDVDTDADAVNTSGGGEGFSDCLDDFADGTAGESHPDRPVEITETPRSHAFSVNQLWFNPETASIPYRAAAALIPGFFGDSDDFTVYLCAVKRGPEAIEDGDGFGLTMPAGNQPTQGAPCGTKAGDQPADATPILLKTVDHNNTESVDAAFDDLDSVLDAGVYGLWTVAAKNDLGFLGCDPFFPVFDTCAFETNPLAPEATIAVDDVDPRFTLTPVATTANADGAAVTRTSSVSLALSAIVDDLPKSGGGTIALSGVDRFLCYVDPGGGLEPRACTRNGDNLNLTLGDGEGRYEVYVVAFDKAENPSGPMSGDLPDPAGYVADGDVWDDDHVTIYFDDTAPAQPTADISVPDDPTGSNGWYLSAPTQYRLDGFDDGAGGSGAHPDGPFLYRFDGADWAPCADDPCLVGSGPLPGAGSHTLSVKAVDGAGLESTVHVIDILIDPTPPQSVVTSIPGFVAGKWITAAHPVAIARGVDEFGGSGVDDIFMSVTGPGGPFTAYTGPRELLPGENQVVCAYSVDVAGNTESPVVACTDPLDVDNQLPTGNITVAPPGPTGNPPWYDGDAPVPTVTFSGYNGTGSPAPVGGGFRYRVDNSAEFSCGNGCVVSPSLLGEGSNVLHWTVVDSAGNRAPEREVDLHVDISDPRSYILVENPKPDGANGWHVTKPWVTLVGFDEPKGTLDLRPIGSGVQNITYTLDGAGPFSYSQPFPIAPGDYDVCVLANDVAGNGEANRTPHCKRIAFDPEDPKTDVLQNGSVTPANDGNNGWYKLSPASITQQSSDVTSGLTPASLSPTLCDHDPGTDPAPAGVCISIDGRAPGAPIDGPEFGPYTGASLLGEGEHVIRAFSVDKAGRRSVMDREVIRVDRSDPVSVGRLRAPQASRVGLQRPWWRHQPTLVLRATDGDQNAGIRRIEYRIDGGSLQTYAAPVTMPVGVHFVEHRAIDESGRVGPWKRIDVAVDVTPPVVKATNATPSPLWLHINLLGIIKLGPDKAKLQWEISDELSGRVNVRIIVYGVTGLAVRHIDGGVQTVTPGVKKAGFTSWDGTDDSLVGFLPAGVYYYRVVATDDAGNVSMSGESKSLQIKLKLVLF